MISPVSSLFKEILEPGGVPLLEVALFFTIIAFASRRRALSGFNTPGLQSGDEAGVAGHRGLKTARSMSGEVHRDEGRLLIGDVQSLAVGRRLPLANVILYLVVVQGRDELFDQVDLVPFVCIRISQVVEYPHTCVQLLHGLIV